MRAVLVDPSAATLSAAEVPDPQPGPGELLVAVRAAGLNRADLAVRAGRYVTGTGRSARVGAGGPVVAGAELAGEVVALGEGVTGWSVGDRVMSQGRGYAELAVTDAASAMPVPPAMSWAEAGGLPVALLTMHDALVTNGRWVAGESVLVHAVTSGVGVIGAQLALHLGAPLVVGTSRTPDKWSTLCSIVADDRLVPVTPGDLVELVRTRTEDRGIDVSIDNVGAAVLAATLEASAVRGRIVQVGRLGGRNAQIDLDELARKRVSLIGVTFRTRNLTERRAVVAAARADLDAAVAAGAFRVPVHATYPLAQASEAQRALAEDRHVGKLILIP